MKQIFFAALLCLCTTAGSAKAFNGEPSCFFQYSSSDIIDQFRNEIALAQTKLPVDLGTGLTLIHVGYNDSTKTAFYIYRNNFEVPKPTPNELKERKQGVIHLYKGSPQSKDMQLLKAGITFHYEYYDMYGNFMYTIKITPSDVE